MIVTNVHFSVFGFLYQEGYSPLNCE